MCLGDFWGLKTIKYVSELIFKYYQCFSISTETIVKNSRYFLADKIFSRMRVKCETRSDIQVKFLDSGKTRSWSKIGNPSCQPLSVSWKNGCT